MDIKKIATLSLSCADFNDVQINRIMQDKTARKAFLDIKVILHADHKISNILNRNAIQ